MQDKLNQLSLGEKLVIGGAVVMFIAGFFDWWSYSSGPFDVGQDGWSAPGSIWSILAILLSLILAGITLAVRLGNVQMPALPTNWTWGMIYAAGAILLALFMLLKLWRILNVEVGGPDLGFFGGVIALGIIGYGCYLLYSADKGGGFASLRR